MSPLDRPLVWLSEEVRTPPLSKAARIEMGYLLRRLQRGDPLGMPASRPMPGIGRRVAELRVTDGEANIEWGLIYRVDPDAIIIVAVFKKKTQATPQTWIETCQQRLQRYDRTED